MENLKNKGYSWERVALSWYQQRGYRVLETNFTIRGGEIDLIVENDEEVVFVEVKVVDGIDDRDSYLSPRKIQALERSIEDFCFRKMIDKPIRLDAAFVQKGAVIEVYENISNT